MVTPRTSKSRHPLPPPKERLGLLWFPLCTTIGNIEIYLANFGYLLKNCTLADPPLILTFDWLATSLVPALFRHKSNLTRSFSRALVVNFHPIGWLSLYFHTVSDPLPISQASVGYLSTFIPWVHDLLTSIPWTQFQSHKVVKYLTTLAPCKPTSHGHFLWVSLPLNFHPCSDGLGIAQLPPLIGNSPLILTSDGWVHYLSPHFHNLWTHSWQCGMAVQS
jgi:hypothetical protein